MTNTHDHFDFERKTQIHLVKTGVKRAGGIALLADELGVTRHTVSRWMNGENSMSGQYVLKLIDWLRKK